MKLLMRITLIALLIISSTSAFSQSIPNNSTKDSVNKPVTDTLFQNKKDSMPYATVYFFRRYVPKMVAQMKNVPIYINDTLINSLKANMLISFKVIQEGKYKLAVDKKGESAIITRIKFGNEYFFQCDVVPGLWGGKPVFQQVTLKEGKKAADLYKNPPAENGGK